MPRRRFSVSHTTITGIVLAAIGLFVYWGVFYANWFRSGPATAEAEATTTTTIVTTTTVPTTTAPVTVPLTTTTSEVTSTTTTTTATTTTTISGEPLSFKWGAGVAQIGVLREPIVDVHLFYTWVAVSGEFIGAYQRDVELSGETMPVWFARFSFGSHLVTGEEIIGDLFLGPDKEEWMGIAVWPQIDGRSTMEVMTGTDDGTMGRPIVLYDVHEFVAMLETNRLYPISLIVGSSLSIGTEETDRQVERICEGSWCCNLTYNELFNENVYNTLSYNNQLYLAMLGESEPPPQTGFGFTLRIDPLPVYSPEG
jgi:hypothetical protein